MTLWDASGVSVAAVTLWDALEVNSLSDGACAVVPPSLCGTLGARGGREEGNSGFDVGGSGLKVAAPGRGELDEAGDDLMNRF
jgi:hypothetical protein